MKLDFEGFPHGVPSEVVFLQHQHLSYVDKSRSQKLRHSLSKIQEEHFVDVVLSAFNYHLLEPLLRHFDNLLERVVEFDLGQFVRRLDYLHGLFVPLLV